MTDPVPLVDGAQEADRVIVSPRRLGYHLMPPIGWMNDPNGFIQFRGEYHLFFQHWPYAPEWGPMHWGHAISPDLVHWRYLPIALAPTEQYESAPDVPGFGCFSGSAAVDDDGNLALLYTGHVDGRSPMQTQNLAVSSDGVVFHKHPANPVIAVPPADGGPDFRDPKIFSADNRTFAVIGSNRDGRGKALLYEAVEGHLGQWRYRGVAAASDGMQGTMWECPDLFPLGDRYVLVVSPMQGSLNTKPLAMVGDFDSETGKFSAGRVEILDSGIDFYAPQTMVDEAGRRIMIAWMQQWHQKNVTAVEGWSGAMTIPRELRLLNGRVVQIPVAEVETLRGAPTSLTEFPVWSDVGSRAEIVLDVEILSGTGLRIGIGCSLSRDECTVFTVDAPRGRITCDRSLSGEGEATSSTAPIVASCGERPGRVELRFFVDTCSVELFVNGGTSTLTNRIYPSGESTGLFVEPIGDSMVVLNQLTVWPMEKIDFSFA